MRLSTALYGRTSKDDPKRVTIEIQQQALREWSHRDQLVGTIFGEYWDDGVTGKLPLWERPKGRQLLEDVKSGKIQSVAVAYIDRFGRTLLDGLQAAAILEQHSVKVVAVNDGFDARRNDDPMYFQLRLMFAEQEHRRIRERMLSGKLRAMERDNAPPGGPLVFGYDKDQHGRFIPDPVEAPIVQTIFKMALEGHSNQAITDWLKTTEAKPGRKYKKRGGATTTAPEHLDANWHATRIGKILRNRIYIGERKWGKQKFPCVALIDLETFNKVQVINKRRDVYYTHRLDPSKALLSGLLLCTCGSKFYSRHMPKQATYYYSCRRQHAGLCNAKLIRASDLDRDVWNLIKSYLQNPKETVRKVLEADKTLSREGTLLADEISRLAAEEQAIEDEVANVWAEQAKNGWPLSWVTTQINKLNTHRASIASKLEERRQRQSVLAINMDESVTVTEALTKMRTRLENLTPEEKYDVIRMIVGGGVIKTTGKGHSKRAEITIQLRWGEQVKDSTPRVPKKWSYGTVGYVTVPVWPSPA